MSKLTDFELYLKVQNGDKSALEQKLLDFGEKKEFIRKRKKSFHHGC
ncbi:hypothetical protein [Fictibacillus sp. FJAT-27399]|nr:hypothetical protein [Fictibacillus sp. FJAT-27399]